MTTHGGLHIGDIVVLVAYVLGILGLGVYFGRRGQDTERFTVANRSLPGWVVGLSIMGTLASSISFLAYPSKGYAEDWNVWVFGLTMPPVAWIAARYFIPYYRRSPEVSAYSHLERRFGPWARNYASALFVVYHLGRIAAITYLMALPLHHLLGWPVAGIIVVMGLLVIVYTLVGGIEAVIWTDVVQTVVLIGGATAAVVILLAAVPGGAGPLLKLAWTEGKLSLGSFGPSLYESTFWVVVAFGLMENLRNFGIDQTFVQRYATARSDKEASRSAWLCALLFLPVSFLLLLVGTGLFAFYAAHPEALPERLHALNMADHVFPHFIVHAMPVGLTGLLIAAIFAAGMSTIDSGLNCIATLTLTDFYRRYVRRDVGEGESMWVLRVSTVAWGVVAVVCALAIIGTESALDLWWQFSSVIGGAVLGLFLLGFLSRRPGNTEALVGVTAGLLLLVWMSLGPSLTPRRAELDLVASGAPPAGTVRTDLTGETVLPRPRTITGVSFYGRGHAFRAAVGRVSLGVRDLEAAGADERMRVPRWRRVPDPTGAPGDMTENLVVNGRFTLGKGGLRGWEPLGEAEGGSAATRGGRLFLERDAATPGIGRVGVSQAMSVEVGEAWNVVLSFDVFVEHQDPPGVAAVDGALEAPLVVEVRYRDARGEAHTWRHGFIASGESDLARITRVEPGEGAYEAYASPFHANLGNAFGTATIVLVGFLATILTERIRRRRRGEPVGN
jgi:SSS family solute:Na+ symporter